MGFAEQLWRRWGTRWQSYSSWSISRLVLVSGVVLTSVTLVTVLLLAASDLRTSLASARSHAALLARVLEDQASRSVDVAQLALEALADSSSVQAASQDPAAATAALQQALVGLPYLRALAVVDREGRVLASSHPEEIGMVLNLAALGPQVAPGQTVLGPLVPGRGLGGIRRGAPPSEEPAGLAFLPLIHTLSGAPASGSAPYWVLGLINPDALSNFQHLTLEGEPFESFIVSYSGTVVAASAGGVDLLGQSLSALPVFRSFLPRQMFGSYIGAGGLGTRQILSFRASASKPLVVLVEQPLRRAIVRWLDGAKALLGIGWMLVLVVVVLTLAVRRSVRSRELAQAAVNAAQMRIAQSERDLSVLLRSVQELIFRTDTAGVITYVNAHWDALRGYSPSTAMGLRLQDIVDEGSRAAVVSVLDPDSAAGVRTCQVMVRFEGGREVFFDLAVVPLIDGEQVTGFAGSAVDITDRRLAQQRLQAQIAFQDLVLETSPLPISVTNIEDQVVLVNKAWELYKGRRREAVLGQRITDFLPREEARIHAVANRDVLAGGAPTQLEMRVLHGDGTHRDTRVFKAAITDQHGQISGVLSILMDVSEFREAERLTREARDAAEEASRSKSEFVANMSHELRTPLQSILGFAELGMLRGRSQPQLASMFEDIHSAGQRMLALVNDLLELSRLESTVGTFHLERTDLRGVVRPIVRELAPLLAQRQLLLDVRMSDKPLLARVDPPRFQQVLRNVLANAIKFSPQGSTITLTAEIAPDDEIHLSIEDQGPGIPESETEVIFEAFVQSSKTKDGAGGTGLGLAISRKIIQAMGGRIYACNLQPHGAAFHIELPMRGTGETAPAPLSA